MDELIYLFAIAAMLAGAMAGVTVWAPRRLAMKLLAIGLAAALMPLGYASLTVLLSRPKPVGMEWLRRSAPEAEVLGAAMQEGEGIYLLLALPGMPEPRYYRLPWSRKLAQQLQDAQRRAARSGAVVALRQPFGRQPAGGGRVFYAKPQPPGPPKAPPAQARTYRRPSQHL